MSLPTDDACHSTSKPENILAASGTKEKIHKATAMPTALFTPIPTISTFYRQPDKLVKYDTKGNYLGQVHLPQKISPSLYFTFSDSLILAHYGEGIGQPQASALLYFNEQGEVKDSLPEFANPGDPMGMDQISSINVFKQLPGNANIGGLIYINYQDGTMTVLPIDQPSLWLNNGSIHFRKAFNDTIYDIKGHEATVHTTFHTGQWHFPAEKMGQKRGYRQLHRYNRYSGNSQTSLLYISTGIIRQEKNPSTVFTTKKKHITYMNDANVGLTDDLTHFMPFLSHHLYRRRRVCRFIGDRENRRMDG